MPNALCQWIHGLGIETFIGSSGRVFPTDMKAAPLLRAWLKRLREAGVAIHTRHRWLGWDAAGKLRIAGPQGELLLDPARPCSRWAVPVGRVWGPTAHGCRCYKRAVWKWPVAAANCGFEVSAWSDLLRSKFAGAPLKNIAIGLDDQALRLGECVI
jgi:predicted flavoprotein YhiN